MKKVEIKRDRFEASIEADERAPTMCGSKPLCRWYPAIPNVANTTCGMTNDWGLGVARGTGIYLKLRMEG